MMTLQEYELEIKTTDIVCRKSIYKLSIKAQENKYEEFKNTFDYEIYFWKDPRWENKAQMCER